MDFIVKYTPIILVEYSKDRHNMGNVDEDIYFNILSTEKYNWYKFQSSKEHICSLQKIENLNQLPNHDNIIAIPKYYNDFII